MSKGKRVALFGIFVGIFLASFTIGTYYRMSEDDAREFLKEFRTSTQGIDAVRIFYHNFSMALLMFLPGFGAAWGAFIGWQTGAGFHVLVVINPQLAEIPAVALFLSTPFGIMELVAYSIGMSRSFILAQTLIKHHPIKNQVRSSLIEIGVVLGLLLAGGLIEYAMIHHATG